MVIKSTKFNLCLVSGVFLNLITDLPFSLGLILPTKKVRKIYRHSDPILDFWKILPNFSNCDPIKNSWILFSEIWLASCTKKLEPIFRGIFSIKFDGSKFSDISKKYLDPRFFVKPNLNFKL